MVIYDNLVVCMFCFRVFTLDVESGCFQSELSGPISQERLRRPTLEICGGPG